MVPDSTVDVAGGRAAAGAATAIPAADMFEAIRALGITDIITVPDTHLKTLLDLLQAQQTIRLLTVCTEDEAIGINAGLHIAGRRPMMLIQNNGFYACLNTVKAISLDARVPTFMLVGHYGREVAKPVGENRLRAVRLLRPTMEVWGIPSVGLEAPSDLASLPALYARVQADRCPGAAVVGAPTC